MGQNLMALEREREREILHTYNFLLTTDQLLVIWSPLCHFAVRHQDFGWEISPHTFPGEAWNWRKVRQNIKQKDCWCSWSLIVGKCFERLNESHLEFEHIFAGTGRMKTRNLGQVCASCMLRGNTWTLSSNPTVLDQASESDHQKSRWLKL